MANALIISKQTGGYFAFNLSIDGAPQDEVRSIQNDLLTVGNTLHFKTSNGANIIKQQNITPAELTIIASGTFTFATVTQVWDKLIEIGFFDWLGTGGGAGVDRFDELLDTFQYFGKDGYVCVVNESQQKLEAVPFYNYRKFTDLEDSPSFLVPNKMVVVNPAGTSLILQDQPASPDTYLNSVGYFDYNDSITHTTPLAFVTNTPKKLTNDTLGVNTNTSENPYGVSYVWNGTTNQFDFSQLSIGDTIDIRIQVQVTTTTANQKFKISAKFGIGSVAQFENTILSSQVKTAGLEEISFVAPFYIGSSYIRDFPAELYITSDAGGTVVVDGWYIRILRKNINILTIESSVPDATTLVKGIVRLGGDLSGTADNPTVPALATKTANTRLINTTAPLSGGGDLSVDRTISIPQADTSTNGYLAGGDWTTFNNKQNGSANLTSVSSLSYVSPAFVKMTGLNTFTLDTNTYLTATTGVTTFSAGTTGLTPSTATSGAVTLAGTLNVLNGGTGSTTASGARTNLGATTVGGNVFTSTNPTAITFLRANADNTVSWLDATTFRTAIGAGTSSTVGTVTSVSALTLGTTGTDLSSTVATGTTTPVITLNVPTASATNRGVLSSADWSTFNGKQNAIAYTPADDSLVVHKSGTETITGTKTFSASPLFDLGARYKTPTLGFQSINAFDTGWVFGVGAVTQSFLFSGATGYNYTFPNADGTLALTSNLSAYQPLLTNPITGAGTTNTIPKFTGVNALGNSTLSDDGTIVNTTGSLTANVEVQAGSDTQTGAGLVVNGAASSLRVISMRTAGSRRWGWRMDNTAESGSNVGSDLRLTSYTDAGTQLSDVFFIKRSTGNFLIGTTTDSNAILNIGKNITGAATSYGISNQGVVQSGVTSAAFYNHTLASTQATTFTTSTLGHYVATQGIFGAGSTVTTQYGFGASATIAGATNNYGFTGNLVAGTNNYNLYMSGTAKNYLAGQLGVGTTTPIGRVNIFTGLTGITDFNVPSQQSGSISFSNIASTSAVPAIIGKSNDNTGLYFISATNNTNANADLELNVRENDGTDFSTLTTPAFRFSRFATVLMDVLRNGNFLLGTTVDNGWKLRVNGGAYLDGNIVQSVSDSRINGGDAVGRLIVSNSGTTTYLGLYGRGHATTPDTFSLVTNAAERINVNASGVVKVLNLAGTGTRTVVADASGNLSTATTYTRALSELFVDTSNTVTTEQTLFTYTIPMGTLAVNGDRIELKEAYNASVINTQSVFTFDGVTVFSNTNSGTGNLARNLIITRVDSTTIKRIDTITGSASNFTVSNLDTTNIVLNLKYTASSVGGATLRMVFLTYFAKS